MPATPDALHQKLLAILRDEYEDCEFFMAASLQLTTKLRSVSEAIRVQGMDFNALRDMIGEIGIFIHNTERRLAEVEDCYTMLVDALASEKPKKQ
jgi:hypothetical protein